MTDKTTDPAAPEEQTPEQLDAAYEQEFNALVAKREAEQSDEPAPPEPVDTEPAPAPAAAEPEVQKEPAAPPVDPDADLLSLVPEDKRDALAQRLKAAEEARARAEKLEQDNRSMAGRMSAYQRRYEEAVGKRPAEAKAAATEEQSAEWKQFTQDYPDIAKAIEARVPKSTAGADPQVAEVVEFVEQEKRQRFLHEAWDAVEAVHAGWRDMARTKEFQAWKGTSPAYERLAASDDVADAIALIDLWKAHSARSAPQPASAQDAAAASQLAARRAQQAEGARTPTNKASTPNPAVDLNDPDQLFAFYAKKANDRMKARYL